LAWMKREREAGSEKREVRRLARQDVSDYRLLVDR
jgi:hypothetical protein